MHGHVRQCLTRVKRIFPHNQPSGGLAAAINLLHVTLHLDMLTAVKSKPFSNYQFESVLRACLIENFSCEYQRFHFNAVEMTSEEESEGNGGNSNSSSKGKGKGKKEKKGAVEVEAMTAAQLILILTDIIEDVDDYRRHFEGVFQPYVKLIYYIDC